MKLSRVFAFVIGAVVLTAAAIATASTPQSQVMFAAGSPVTLTGATKAAPGATTAGGVVIDTVNTLTNGYLLDVRNNGTSKANIDFAGTLTTLAFSPTGAVTFLVTAPASVATTGTAASAAFTATGQAGGASSGGATNNAAGVGSADSIKSGAGGVASGTATGTNTGGAGGTMTFGTGAGGASSGATTASTGGAGGAGSYAAGIGGAATGTATTNTGGAGGAATVSSGTGGAASGGTTNNGGAGGTLSVTGGAGGNGTQTGGAGGTIAIAAGSAGTGGNAAAGNVTIAAGTATGSGAAGSITIGTAVAAARAGVRTQASRVIVANKPTAPPDCAGATLNLTVTQFLEAGIFTCATAQTVNLPTWQGASGIVQNLPGTPAVGDIVQFVGAATAANAITMGFGVGGTNGNGGHTTIPANSTQTFNCRITVITTNSETATCY